MRVFQLLFYLVAFIIAFFDFKNLRICNAHVILFAVSGFIAALPSCANDFFIRIFSAFAMFFLTYALYRRCGGIGGGDVKLCAATALVLGFSKASCCILAACVLAIVYGLFLHYRKIPESVQERRNKIPFGSFLCPVSILLIGQA
ncbi:MAG: A24 family peptidase [Treponema sp.]|nr:A24 family peptidase [Treponema sp.]